MFDGLIELILQLVYLIWLGGAYIVNLIEDLFRMLVGLNPVQSGVDSGADITTLIINNRGVQQIFTNLVAFATIMLIFFTILQIIREHYKDKHGGNPYVLVFRMVKAMVLFMFVTAACIIGLQLSSVVLRALDRATGYDPDGGIGGVIFVAMAASGNRVSQGIEAASQRQYDLIDDTNLYTASIAATRNKEWAWIENPEDIQIFYGSDPDKFFEQDVTNPNDKCTKWWHWWCSCDDDKPRLYAVEENSNGVILDEKYRGTWERGADWGAGNKILDFDKGGDRSEFSGDCTTRYCGLPADQCPANGNGYYIVQFNVEELHAGPWNYGAVRNLHWKNEWHARWEIVINNLNIYVLDQKGNAKRVARYGANKDTKKEHKGFRRVTYNSFTGADAHFNPAGVLQPADASLFTQDARHSYNGSHPEAGLTWDQIMAYTDYDRMQGAYHYYIITVEHDTGRPVDKNLRRYGVLNASYFYLTTADKVPLESGDTTLFTYYANTVLGGNTLSGRPTYYDPSQVTEREDYANWIDNMFKRRRNVNEYLRLYNDKAWLFKDRGYGQMRYPNVRAVNMMYDIKSFNWIVGFGGLFIAMGVYNSFAFGMIQRIAELGVLYMFSPVTLAFFPFDDGAQFNNAFVKPFYKKAISSYAPVLSLNLFFVVLPAFDAIRWFQNGLLNTVASCIVSIALLSMLPKVRTTIQTMLGADPMEEKKMFGKGGVLANAVDKTKGTVKGLQKFGVARGMNARDIAGRIRNKREARQAKRDGITSGAYQRDRQALRDADGKVMQDAKGNAIYESQEDFNKRTGLNSKSPLGAARREAMRRSLKNDDLNAQLKASGVNEADLQGLTGVALRQQRDRANKKEARNLKSGKLTGEEGLNAALEGAGAVPGGALDSQAAADAINKGSIAMRRQTLESYFKNAGAIANVTEEVKDKDGKVVTDKFNRPVRRIVRDKDGNAVKRKMTDDEIKRATAASLKSGRKLTASEVELARKDGGLETTRERLQRERDSKFLEENGKSIADRMLTDPARAKAVADEAKTKSADAETKAVQDASGSLLKQLEGVKDKGERKEIALKWMIEMGYPSDGKGGKKTEAEAAKFMSTDQSSIKNMARKHAEGSKTIAGGKKEREEQALQDARQKAVKDALKDPRDRKHILDDWVAAETKAGRKPEKDTEVSDKEVRSALVASRQRAWDQKAFKHLLDSDSVTLKTKEQGGMLDATDAKHKDFFETEIEKDKNGNPIKGGERVIKRDQNGHAVLKSGADLETAFHNSLGDIDSDNRKTFGVNKAVFDTGLGGAWDKTKHMAKGTLSTLKRGPWGIVDAVQGGIGNYLESDHGKSTYFGTMMTTLFQPDFGLFYETGFGKAMDGFSSHKTFQGLDQLEKARSDRLKTEAFARGRAYRFAGQFADVTAERQKIDENNSLVKEVYSSTNPDVALQNKENRENLKRLEDASADGQKAIAEAVTGKQDRALFDAAFKEHMGDMKQGAAYDAHAQKFYETINNGTKKAFEELSGTFGAKLFTMRETGKKEQDSVTKETVEKSQAAITKYERVKSLVMEGDEIISKDKYDKKVERREKQLTEYIGGASRVLGIGPEAVKALNDLRGVLTDPNGEYVKVMKGYQKGGNAAETVMLNGKLTTIDTKEAFKAYQEQAYKPYTDGVEAAIAGSGGFSGVAFRDYGEKTSDRMDGILGATMAGEQIKLMQDTIWKTHRDSHQLFRDPAFIKMLEGSQWQEIAEQFDKASRGEECAFDHTLVSKAKKHDLKDIGNMFKDMLGDAEGEMRGGGFSTASNIIARTFRTAFVDQINEALKATAGMYDQNQLRAIEQRGTGMRELNTLIQSGNAEVKSIFAGMESTIKTLDTSTDAKKMDAHQQEMLRRLDALIAAGKINNVDGADYRNKINGTFSATRENLYYRNETDLMTYRMRELTDLDFIARNMMDRKDDKLQ